MTRRQPSQYNWPKLQFDETILNKHYNPGRSMKIAFVVAHHMTIVGTGNGRANDACYTTWQTRKASAHYGVDGNYVRQFVWDKNGAWATGHSVGNSAGISIEHANSAAGGSWPISETTWKNGAKLAAYLHRAHGLGRPYSTNGGKGGTLRKHSSFFATACPGPFFDSIWSRYVAEAQRVYDTGKGSGAAPTTPPTPAPEKKGLLMGNVKKFGNGKKRVIRKGSGWRTQDINGKGAYSIVAGPSNVLATVQIQAVIPVGATLQVRFTEVHYKAGSKTKIVKHYPVQAEQVGTSGRTYVTAPFLDIVAGGTGGMSRRLRYQVCATGGDVTIEKSWVRVTSEKR